MSLVEKERKALVVHHDEKMHQRVAHSVADHILNFSFYFAKNGSEAMFKIENDRPDLVIIDPGLPSTTIEKFIHWLFTENNFEDMAVVILSDLPKDSTHIDEMVLGKVHYLPYKSEQLLVSQVLSRALNYLSRNLKTEYSLKFLAPGDYLIREGETDANVYILKSGKLEASVERDGEHRFLGHIVPGEFVGEMAYINGEKRSANVKSISDAELIEIPSEKLDHMVFERPSWSKALMKTLSKRLKKANKNY